MTTYRDMAFTLAMSVLKDRAAAEDAVQDAFVEAFQALPRFRRTAKFSSWLYRIVVHRALKQLKKQQREKLTFLENRDDEPIDEGLLLSWEAKERRTRINEGLDRLAPDESLALRLFYLEECSIHEVKEITGWSSAKVKVCLHRGRKHLLILLNKQLKENGEAQNR